MAGLGHPRAGKRLLERGKLPWASAPDNECRWERRCLPRLTKRQPAPQEEDRGMAGDVAVPPASVRSGWQHGYHKAGISRGGLKACLGGPIRKGPAVGWVEEHGAVPGKRQAVVFRRVVNSGAHWGFPRVGGGRTGVEVETPKDLVEDFEELPRGAPSMMRGARAGVRVELEAFPSAKEFGTGAKNRESPVEGGKPAATSTFQLDEGRLTYADEGGKGSLAEASAATKGRDLVSNGRSRRQVLSAQGESQGRERLVPRRERSPALFKKVNGWDGYLRFTGKLGLGEPVHFALFTKRHAKPVLERLFNRFGCCHGRKGKKVESNLARKRAVFADSRGSFPVLGCVCRTRLGARRARSLVVLGQKHGCLGPIVFGNHPKGRAVGGHVPGADAKPLVERALIHLGVVLVEVAPVASDVSSKRFLNVVVGKPRQGSSRNDNAAEGKTRTWVEGNHRGTRKRT